MGTLSLRLTDELDARLEREAQAEQRPKSEIARRALAEWLTAQERQRRLDAINKAADAIVGDANEQAQWAGWAEADDGMDTLIAEERTAGIDPEEKWWS